MFIWNISDAIGVVVVAIIVLIVMFVSITELIRQARCKHDGGVNETQACDAICRKCGKNLGFIGTWREKSAVPN
jgi:lysylphosphatidylglycerol synthetase-like protein (DUF2156 family)